MGEREAWMDRDWTIVILTIVLIIRVKQSRIQVRMCIWLKLRNIVVEMEGNKTNEAKVFWNHIQSLIIILPRITKIRLVRWVLTALREQLQLTFQPQALKELQKLSDKLFNKLVWSNSIAARVKTKIKVNITEAKTWLMITVEVKPKVKALSSNLVPFMERKEPLTWIHISLILSLRLIWTKT